MKRYVTEDEAAIALDLALSLYVDAPPMDEIEKVIVYELAARNNLLRPVHEEPP